MTSTRIQHRSRRAHLVVAACVLALVGGMALGPPGVSAAPSGQQGTARPVPLLDWHRCGRLQCTRAPVPLDYDDPTAGAVRLALVRARATGHRPAKGTIFLNPGGPGGSGVGFVRALRDDLFTAQVRRRFDLVGFDPRGIARSRPVECFDSVDAALDVLAPFPFPLTDRQERRWVRADTRYSRACADDAGPIIDHMSTANVARDVDLLRRAVGDRRTTFVGYSYGSMIGSTYAAMFPEHVRAVVVDGVIDPVSWSTGRGDQAQTRPVDARLRSEQGAYATLQQFLTLCDDGGSRCAFSGGDPRRRYHRLAQRLRDDPVRVRGFGRVTYNTLVSITLGSMYSPQSWRFLARVLDELERRSRPERVAGRLDTLGEQLEQAPVPGLVRPVRGLTGRESTQVLEGFAGVTCSDTDNPDDPSAWAAAAAAADRRNPYFGRAWIWGSSICASWPGVDTDRFTGPYSPDTANPVLVVGTRFDPATRYRDAVGTADVLGRARLLTLEGWGHTSLFKSACIDDYTAQYLLHRRLPPRGATCRADRIPFDG